jgi:cyclase
LLRDRGLVKTIKFAEPKYVGDPINAIRIFNEKEVDELMVLDITASKEGREPDYALIEEFAGECFMPLSYGGGVRSVEQARRLFALGIEKVCVQSAALEDLRLVTGIAEQFGTQSVLVSVDVKKNWLGKHRLYSSRSSSTINRDWLEFMKAAVAAGAGEIVLNSVDRDGCMQGMDVELIRIATASITVPLIAMGGVGRIRDISSALRIGVSGVAVGSFFVFHGPHRAVLITYPTRGELESVLERP